MRPRLLGRGKAAMWQPLPDTDYDASMRPRLLGRGKFICLADYAARDGIASMRPRLLGRGKAGFVSLELVRGQSSFCECLV